MNKNFNLKNVAAFVPLFVLMAYSIGFMVFVFYFIEVGVVGKINIFSYLSPGDHLAVFGMGTVLTIFLFLPLISPSLLIQVEKGEKIKITIKYLTCFLLGGVVSLLIMSLLQNKYPDNAILLKAWFHIIIFIATIGLVIMINTSTDYHKAKKKSVVIASLIFCLLLVFFHESIIKFAGYGNRWACLALSEEEGNSIIRNPEFGRLFEKPLDRTYFTAQRVFIVLQLRDYIFVADDFDKKNIKLNSIEVIKGARIFSVSNRRNIEPTVCMSKQ